MNHLQALIELLDRLEAARIHYSLCKIRNAIMVEVAVPGQRWEIEFFADGHIEREVFESVNGVEDIPSAAALEDLIAPWADLRADLDSDA